MVRSNVPKRGDVFRIDLNPVVGNESRDTHRCVVISPREINELGMCLTVVIATGGQFARKAGLAVNILGQETTWVALCNHICSFDIVSQIQKKTARYVDTLDSETIDKIVAKVVGVIDAT